MSNTGLPEPWILKISRSRNRPYFFNPQTHESLWEAPASTNMEALHQYMINEFSVPNSTGLETPSSPKIRVSHLLVKHKESRRPSSWREEHITRTKEEAWDRIHHFENLLKEGVVNINDLAMQESDCSSARRGGDLGFFGRNEMQKPFEDAAFALQPGELSHVVETNSGYHLIQRTA
ncbi:peptidyl-prolyl cis-trans isomerase Pin1 [Schizosaccharomyces cryophilus OY26]|uniref:Peptidyl-prolyl cis-trans isomerase n=1 Tax=Schizosaccharomyces cryophilus (strain OY26 / ATCC MYA-4695 / CBS 11777 / NBRC 106824 / NRRL Y48691) TaxID=653667 RepID=S9VPM1_SCHCR|nr:peptidyl-prolyl cis-trans isomerase Pin1 [Schizosaccharomyces cryophilus OY26]EPY49878.1 peptidyl-prolyl cis-trans isomerase Pin1 [Schizosaccharomyces cryophilus OY26]